MKTSKLVSALAVAAALGNCGAASADTLTIVVEDIRRANGTVQVQVLASQGQFDGDGVAMEFIQEAIEGSMTFTADGLAPGEYAVRVMHDVNGNDELDANFVGMPTEPYAFSNNAKGVFGPAKWEDARFVVAGSVTQVISLVH